MLYKKYTINALKIFGLCIVFYGCFAYSKEQVRVIVQLHQLESFTE
tara:strand:+ start:7072 stop:7209 length:138 start_codon:yes stop_codon:yes gene_type:complete